MGKALSKKQPKSLLEGKMFLVHELQPIDDVAKW